MRARADLKTDSKISFPYGLMRLGFLQMKVISHYAMLRGAIFFFDAQEPQPLDGWRS
jgi:hypothetical protein